MRECTNPPYNGELMDGLSLHYYMNGLTPPAKVARRMPSTGFGNDDWNRVMSHGWFLDELLRKHIAIMDRHDPIRRMGLIVDEWGAWYSPEPGYPTNEYFQQQTVRDAVLAALTVHQFINHAERVSMANAAQVINVLHSMILTWGAKMVCTPTWHVFGMYTPHQDATRLPVTGHVPMVPHEDGSYPRVSAAASLAADNSVTVTLAHTDPAKPATVELSLNGLPAGAQATGRILASSVLDAVNSPENPNLVAAQPWTDFSFDGNMLIAHLPPGCVAALTFK
jgi:alpha-N-arabinofuranosidase